MCRPAVTFSRFRLLRQLIEFYQSRLEALQPRTNASVLWRLSSKRLVHVAMHLLFASALILF